MIQEQQLLTSISYIDSVVKKFGLCEIKRCQFAIDMEKSMGIGDNTGAKKLGVVQIKIGDGEVAADLEEKSVGPVDISGVNKFGVVVIKMGMVADDMEKSVGTVGDIKFQVR